MKKKILFLFSLLFVAGLILTACQPAAEAPKEEAVEEAAEPAAAAGFSGIYQVGVFEDITTLNYWAANGPDNTVWNAYLMPNTLTLYGLTDKYFTFVPVVAKDFPGALTEEGDYWVVEIPIRDDIVWSDLTSLSAEDVAFTANAVLKLGLISGNWQQWYDANYLDRMEAVDAYTVKIYYHTKPGLARHEWGTLQAPIVSKAYWETVVAEAMASIDALAADASDEDVVTAKAEAHDILFAHEPEGEPTAGAFTFTKWEKGAFFENAANPNYFDTGKVIKQYADGAYEDSEGLVVGSPTGEVETEYTFGPFVESTIYSVYGDQTAALLALQAGDVSFVINPLGLQRGLAESVANDPNLTVLANPVNGFRYLSFNVRREPMKYIAFRQAVATLIDKEYVTSTILQGVAFPLYSYVPEANTAWYYDDVTKLGQGLTREERVIKAVEILEEAGFSWKGNKKPVWDETNRYVVPAGQLIMPDGKPVPELDLVGPSAGYDPLRSTFAIFIEKWLNDMGIPVKATLAGFNVIVPIIFTEQDFDMYILGWSCSIFPSYLYDFFAEEQAVLDGNNAGGYVSEEFETLAKGLMTCDTEEACKVIADDIQTLLATETPYVLLFDTGIYEAYRSASVEYPYTVQLSGLQYTHQQGALQPLVRIK